MRNALAAYERLGRWRPTGQVDLLEAHRTLMSGLVDDAGIWRRQGVGVMAGSKLLHMASQADRVPQLMKDLLRWLARTGREPGA